MNNANDTPDAIGNITWTVSQDFTGMSDVSLGSNSGQQLSISGQLAFQFDPRDKPRREQYVGIKTPAHPVPGYGEGKVVFVGRRDPSDQGAYKRVLCKLPNGRSMVGFTVTEGSRPVTIDFYDNNGVTFNKDWESFQTTSFLPTTDGQTIVAAAPRGKKIYWIRISAPDTVHIDNFGLLT